MFAVRENWAHDKQDLTSCRERASPRKRSSPFLCRALLETHDKDFSPCVVKEGARQCTFTVRYATVCLLPCALTKNARQRLCRAFFSLCRALEAHGKPKFSRSGYFSRDHVVLHDPFVLASEEVECIAYIAGYQKRSRSAYIGRSSCHRCSCQ
jgi:hypothetical protein